MRLITVHEIQTVLIHQGTFAGGHLCNSLYMPLGFDRIGVRQLAKLGECHPVFLNLNEEYFVGENIWINISDMKSKVVYDSEKHISDEAVRLASMNISPKGSFLCI